MRCALTLGLAGALLLPSCQQSEQADGSAGNATASATKARDDAIQFQPGQWEMITKVSSVDMPGMPPEMAKGMAGRTNSVSHCMTEAQAKSAPQDMLMKSTDGQCAYDSFSMTGGRLDAVMTCKGAQGGQTRVKMSGDYAPTEYSATSQMTISVPGAKPMTMSAAVSGKRVGACKA